MLGTAGSKFEIVKIRVPSFLYFTKWNFGLRWSIARKNEQDS
jgi:hypothetical protein